MLGQSNWFRRFLSLVMMTLVATAGVAMLSIGATAARAADRVADGAAVGAADAVEKWSGDLSSQLLDYYQNSDDATMRPTQPIRPAALAGLCAPAEQLIAVQGGAAPFPFQCGQLRARVQQALVLEMNAAVLAGDVERAKSIRAELDLPRGVSAAEGSLLLQSVNADQRAGDAKILVREAITWQTSRVRQLLAEALHSTHEADVPMPGRLLERLGEAMTLADLPDALRQAAGIASLPAGLPSHDSLATIEAAKWSDLTPHVLTLRDSIESRLPSLLSDKEKQRRERLLLKLVQLVPKEYSAGVRDGQVTVALEYREAVSFTQQARQIVGELAPLWLTDRSKQASVEAVEHHLDQADQQIALKTSKDDVESTLNAAAKTLENDFGITLRRSGTTADIVDEVMLETRALLSSSLSAALGGNWSEAERIRVEAYTTYDPELENRLLPRDPQLAMNIERLLLDGIDKPGVKVLLDQHADEAQLTEAYSAVNNSLERAGVMLKSGISPTAASFNAGSIVLREGLEGLLVIVAILAGLRGAENARRRRLFWIGIAASLAATAITWLISQFVITSLRAYGEVIAAITGFLAIGVLLLITNWLFHQVYWRQWVSTLKAQAAEGERVWQLITVGFLVGYREGFETVLFLQSLMLDAGGLAVGIGVAVGCLILLGLGYAALKLGMKLPYFKILLITAAMIGVVLITFVGATVRAAQTVGWLPVHRLMPGSWPLWTGNWLGLYNTWETVAMQVAMMVLVLGTWRLARWQAKRASANRRLECAMHHKGENPLSACDPADCGLFQETPEEKLAQLTVMKAPLPAPKRAAVVVTVPETAQPQSVR